MKRIILFIFTASAAMGLVSCNPSSPRGPSTISWVDDGSGFIQYQTVDERLYDEAVVKLYTEAQEAVMTTVTVAVKKISGSADIGFGVAFCGQDEDNFYRVIIDTTGMYKIMKKVDGTDSILCDWASAPSFSKGFDALNTISITQSSPGIFSVAIDGAPVHTFTDLSFAGGTAGFYVAIDSAVYENFPSIPEDVRFQMSLPVAIP